MNNDQLTVHVESLVRARDEEIRSRKYVHNMLEDLGTTLRRLELSAARCEADIQHRKDNEQKHEDWIKEIQTHQRTIERLVWIGVGGILILGGFVTIVGRNILKLLAQ